MSKVTKVADSITLGAVEKVRTDWCKEFFTGRKKTPRRLFCEHYDGQTEDLIKSFGLVEMSKARVPHYYRAVLPISQFNLDFALQQQDRRNLSREMVLEQTMRSFVKNGNEVNAPACLVRKTGDDRYIPGDGRHRLVWSLALGCEHASAWVVVTDDDQDWQELREACNDTNGAQRSTEERLYLVHSKFQRGGCGSVKQLCLRHGVAYNRYVEFAKHQKLSALAQAKGLSSHATTPTVILEESLKLMDSHDKDQVQRLIDAATPAPSEAQDKPAKAPSKKKLQAILDGRDILGSLGPPKNLKEIEALLKKATRTAGSRGPNKATYQKLKDGLELLEKVMKKGLPHEIGVPEREISVLQTKGEGFVAWLGSAKK